MWFLTEVLPGLIVLGLFSVAIKQNLAFRKKLEERKYRIDKLNIDITADSFDKMIQEIITAVNQKEEENGN